MKSKDELARRDGPQSFAARERRGLRIVEAQLRVADQLQQVAFHAHQARPQVCKQMAERLEEALAGEIWRSLEHLRPGPIRRKQMSASTRYLEPLRRS